MKISQREARRLRKRVEELEGILREQSRAWAAAWPRGVNIGRETTNVELRSAISTARKLNHAVVCTVEGDFLCFHAMLLTV